MSDLFPPRAEDDTDQLEIEKYAARPASPPVYIRSPRRTVPKTASAAPRPPAPPAPSLERTMPMTPRPGTPVAPPAALPVVPPSASLSVPSAAPRRARPRQHLSSLTVALIALIATLLTGTHGYAGLRALNTAQPGTPGRAAAVPALAEPTEAPLPTFGAPAVEIQPWSGTERFTLLVLGLDKRPYQTGTAFRTDTMILLSIDPATNTAGMLSIPRDLFVEIPAGSVAGRSYGLQRVNTAYFLGEQIQPGYGPTLAMQTVQYNLGLRVNDYLVFDFEAVIALIDAVGGVEITVQQAISDQLYPDMFGGYEPLFIAAGPQHMDGALALKYARSRHGNSDFARARRQQEVIDAVRVKASQPNLLPQLLISAPGLWSQLSRHVQSGLSLDQLLQLAVYAKDIPTANIRRGVIDSRYVQSITYNGAAVLVPNRAAIGPLLVEVFGPDVYR